MPINNESPLDPARPYTHEEKLAMVKTLGLANGGHTRTVGDDVYRILVDPKKAEGDK